MTGGLATTDSRTRGAARQSLAALACALLGHPKLWHWSRRGVAPGVALGVFFGLLIPLALIAVTAAVAIVLRANLPAAASTLISNPVTFAPLYYMAYHLGAWVTGETAPPSEDAETRGAPEEDKTILQRIKSLGQPLLVGLSIMACLAGRVNLPLSRIGHESAGCHGKLNKGERSRY